MAFSDALKPKYGSRHLSTIINAEGKAVIAESREDEQQKVKYKEIIDLLVGAGYYRAKIKGLSQFDKVVGGMSWCIDICKMDLDVDLLFQENSTIGQKITLTEKIVAVLPKMHCPYAIEPHQIQGLDFIHIYPWLVKKSMENREERGDYLRQFAVHQFNKNYQFPNEKPNSNFILRALPNLSAIQNKYGSHRKFRRVAEQQNDVTTRVQSTLFEYGLDPTIQEENETDTSSIKEKNLVNQDKVKQLTKMMKETSEEVEIATKSVSSIINLNASEIKEATVKYSALSSETGLEEENELKKLKMREASLIKDLQMLEASHRDGNIRLKKLKERISTQDENLTNEEKSIVKELETKLLFNNALLEQEVQFREHCKLEKSHFQELIKSAEGCRNAAGDSTNELNQEISEARISLAKISRLEAGIYRLMDEVPSRPELSQYQRRFLELYNQVSAKHRETKQFYTLYNSMSDELEYLNKELALLKSITKGYEDSVKSTSSREEFVKQFTLIIDGVKHNKLKVEQKRNEERDLRDRLRAQLLNLIDQQRQYASLLKQFTAECEKSQDLLKKIKSPKVVKHPLS